MPKIRAWQQVKPKKTPFQTLSLILKVGIAFIRKKVLVYISCCNLVCTSLLIGVIRMAGGGPEDYSKSGLSGMVGLDSSHIRAAGTGLVAKMSYVHF